LAIFTAILQPIWILSECTEDDNSMAICRTRQTDVNKTESYVGDIPFDFPHEFSQEFSHQTGLRRIFFLKCSITLCFLHFATEGKQMSTLKNSRKWVKLERMLVNNFRFFRFFCTVDTDSLIPLPGVTVTPISLDHQPPP